MVTMDCSVFSKKNVNTKNRDDRFVMPREYVTEMRRRSWNGGNSDPLGPDISIAENMKRNKYVKYLDGALSVHKDPSRQEDRLWPCVPRKKTYLSSADSILDLPTYSSATLPELLDWGKDNILVAALGSGYHKWSCSSQQMVSRVSTLYDIQCCKFDPRGELLLLGTLLQRVEVHSHARDKREAVVKCQGGQPRPSESKMHICSITAVDWSPTGNSFVMGCSYGAVTSCARSAEVISRARVAREAVWLLRVSPDARFVAVTAVHAATVLLLSWPALNMYSKVDANWMVKTIAWHPWRSALLGVGAMSSELRAYVAMFHAPTTTVHQRALTHKRYGLDAMLFSERSGELVAGLWHYGGPRTCSHLVVLSDPETVVDEWGDWHCWPDRVRTMVFSPDGTKLATATLREDLIIWNFLPEDKKQKKSKRKRFSAFPVYQDVTTQGFSIR